MTLKERFELVAKDTEEVLTKEHLMELLKNNEKLKHYIGFEISGKIHLGTGLMCMSKVRDFQKAGVECSIFLADWHSWINDKLGGDIETIRKIAGGYFKEGMVVSLKCVRGNPDKVKFILGSELYHNNDKYWQTLIDVSKHTTLSRIMRSITIMGRKEGESVDFAKLVYPPMQVADIFIRGINLTHSGNDQRKAHVIALDVAEKLKVSPLLNRKKEKIKPVAVHHHLLLGLQKPTMWPIPKDKLQEVWASMKMSKSIPSSAVFIHDGPDEIRKKLRSAFCPEKEVGFNPVLDWARYLLFSRDNFVLKVERSKKFGGDISFDSYDKLAKTFAQGNLHPLDFKNSVAEALVKILEPARKHFKKPRIAKMKEELERLKVTR